MARKRLYNIINSDELKRKLREDQEPRTTMSFYRYMEIADPDAYRDGIYEAWEALGVCGRIYVATEGVNAQISIPDRSLESFKEQMPDFNLEGIRLNIAIDDDGKSFYKLKIKVKDKIVADGLNEDDIDWTNRGKHLSAEEFNEITDRPDTVVVDMRNHYESEIGHFENAICPDVETFRESLPVVRNLLGDDKSKPVVMYCTGGIRCEKASAYLRANGFEEVYQLDGGIIEYARQVDKKGLSNKFRGKNFVFDERMGEQISGEVVARCHQCGEPADKHVNCANDACHILFIQCEECARKYSGCCSEKCEEFVRLPHEEQRRLRKTEVFNGTKFGKGRYKAARAGQLGPADMENL